MKNYIKFLIPLICIFSSENLYSTYINEVFTTNAKSDVIQNLLFNGVLKPTPNTINASTQNIQEVAIKPGDIVMITYDNYTIQLKIDPTCPARTLSTKIMEAQFNNNLVIKIGTRYYYVTVDSSGSAVFMSTAPGSQAESTVGEIFHS